VNASFTVSLSAAPSAPVSIPFSTADGAATAGSDYQPTAGVLTFLPGGALWQTITVPVLGDRLAEPVYSWQAEQFFVNLGTPTGAILNDNQGVATIIDNEPEITGNSITLTEGNSGTRSALFSFTMAAASDGPVTVAWSTMDASAMAGSDYQAASGVLTFNPGASLTQSVSVPVIGDRLADSAEESFYVFLGNGGYGYATILDDEPRISISDATVTEGNSGTANALFTLTLSRPYDAPVTVNFSTAEGDTQWWYGDPYYGYYPPPPSATAGSDFQSQSGAVTFAAGQTQRTISVAVNGDRAVEPSEYFSVDLTGSSDNAVVVDNHGVGIIVDDETRVSVNSTTVTEANTGTTNALFTVTLSSPSDQAVTVTYATAVGSAGSNDFVAASGTLTFSPGQTSKMVSVAVLGDVRDEYDEYFFLNLTSVSGAEIDAGSASAAIVDNDPPPAISISDAALSEGQSGTKVMVFTVRLSAASDKDVWVNYSTSNGTAKTSDNDYVATSGLLYFAPGETTKTISVVINGDRKREKKETFNLNLFNAYDAVFADAKGVGSILNDD
jgi:hypothetical protein